MRKSAETTQMYAWNGRKEAPEKFRYGGIIVGIAVIAAIGLVVFARPQPEVNNVVVRDEVLPQIK